jgi:DNA-directed RNA polymerase subunit RPC12/RpoP
MPLKRPAGRFVTVPVMMTVITCPSCGDDVDLCTGDDETRCLVCNFTIYRKQRADH